MKPTQPFRRRNLEQLDPALKQLNQLVDDSLAAAGPRTQVLKFTNVMQNVDSYVELVIDNAPWPLAGALVLAVLPVGGQDASSLGFSCNTLPSSDGRWVVRIAGFPGGYNTDFLWQVNVLLVEDSNG